MSKTKSYTVLPEDLLFPERTSVTAPCPMGTPAPGGAPRRLRPGSDVTFTEGEKRSWTETDVQWCAPTLTPPSARTHILSRHDMLGCDRKPAAHTMVWGSFLQANTLHERPHQLASITPHSRIG